MVVGLLAILKAGAGYLPLDDAHPAQRLAFMLIDSHAPVLLCHRRLVSELPGYSAAVLPPEEWEDIAAGRNTGNPPCTVEPHNLAYVLYTSGSTGLPKGVLISQRALVNLLCSMRRWFDFNPDDILLAVTTISFDIAAIDMWLPLVTGARIVIVSRFAAADGNALMRAISSSGATFMQATPSTWHLMLEAGWQGNRRLRVVCTGEAMPRELAGQLVPRTKRLWNMYGPTETTVWSTGYEIKAPGRVLIGRPVGNTATYILDSHLQPVPVGVVGELHIGGAGLSLGYLNRPELTDEKFIPDPFVASPTARLYKTGDLARYLPDGNIECLGRNDNQVKIRGFRIELCEIEAALLEHAGVHQVVVLPWDESGRRYLAAYLVPRGSVTLSEDDLRDFLREKLPHYMLPARYEFLRAMPLTSSGKVDRLALRPPGQTSQNTARRPYPPHDAFEKQLIGIWEDVLRTPPIGRESDFFDMGGDSLLAARLLRRIERQFNRTLSLAALFHAPTIERLAGLLRDPMWSSHSRVIAIQESGSRPPFFCLGAGPLFRNLANRLGADQPFLTTTRADGADALPVPHRLEDIAAYHLGIIREAQRIGPYFLGGWSDAAILAYEVAQQLQEEGQCVALLALFDAENPTYAKSLSELRSLSARVDSAGRWISTYWDLLRNSEWNDRLRRVREGLTYRLDRFKGRIRTSTGLQDNGDPSESTLALAIARYQPRPYHGRLVLFQRSARPAGPYHDPKLGWGQVVDGLEIQEIPGDHKDMFLEPNVRILAEKLHRCLLDAQESGRPLS
jgi:amino acid adenylation domain-containing protein